MALLCYSHGLASYLDRLCARWPRRQRPAHDGEFHDLGLRWGADEAQDFADEWWIPLLGALRDPVAGGLYVFSDEGQRVLERVGRPPVPLVPLVLDTNLRNTRQIAECFAPLTGERMRLRGADGSAVLAAVVLAVNSGVDSPRQRERVCVALSRARDERVVCGNPAVVRAVGGEELARRLGC